MSAVDATPDSRLRPDPITTSVLDSEEFAWRVLILLNVFRLTLGSMLLALFLAVTEPRIIGGTNPTLAWGALLAMLAFGVVEIWLLRHRSPSSGIQIYAQLALDLTVTTALMHASGGVSSGVGGLLIVSIGALALLVPRERSFLFAAVAALTMLGEQTLSQLQGATGTAAYAPTGILGAVIFVIAIVVQVLRHRMLETEALAEQRGVDLKNLGDLNQYIVQHLRESIVVVDGDDRLRLINESAATQLGVSSRGPNQLLSDVSPELADRLEAWRNLGSASSEPPLNLTSADGTTTIIPHFASMGSEHSGGTLIFLEDTSLLAERVQQTKLASLGRLSASIAHEIRNPLGAMSHAGQLLAESPDIGPEERRLTDIIRVNGTRVSQIVESVLALSRRDKTRPERVQLKPWIEEFVQEFVQTLELTEDAVTVLDSTPDTEVRMDLTHLHQIVWNLCDNAVKYGGAPAGAITVELNCGRLEASGRPYLEIADRGPGIDPDKVEEVFEPFYTGADGGTGSGCLSRGSCVSITVRRCAIDHVPVAAASFV
jgi:two-component system sensor histidine kinase PilS (NtrC family)